MFLNNSLGLAIYPTDWAAENFAVDKRGKVRLVDLENIVLVNQSNMAMYHTPGMISYFDNFLLINLLPVATSYWLLLATCC